jgi:hypothetical protein
MSPNPNMNQSREDNSSSSELSKTVSPSAPYEGSEGILPLPTHETPNSDIETEKPVRAGQIGEGSYEGTRGYANSVKAYMGTANVSQDAKAAAPHSASEARELRNAESEAASHSKAPGK